MARTPITPVSPKGPYFQPQNPGDLALILVPVDVANGNCFPPSGADVLAFWNSDTVNTHTITFTSSPDEYGRSGDVTYTMQPGEIGSYYFQLHGWQQADGNIWFSASDASVKVLISPIKTV